MLANLKQLSKIAKLVRYYILKSTSRAGSGHPSSSLSAVELMSALMFGGIFCFDQDDPAFINNDRLIFSKGHAAPLLYTLWTVAGQIQEKELMTLRQFGSRLEGHPTPSFPYSEAATGSLGQGLSIGAGMAINAKMQKLSYHVYVLLGDSEMAEGSVWEAIQLASFYKLNNLIGIIDVNRLGQRGETMYGHNVKAYEKRIRSFGWQTIIVDGHSLNKIIKVYRKALKSAQKPVMIIAKTVKGRGVSFIEDKDNWHGKPLNEADLKKALKEIGKVDKQLRGDIKIPQKASITNPKSQIPKQSQIPSAESADKYAKGQSVATRKAYGNALVRLYPKYPNIVSLDAETSNSTYAEIFKEKYPDQFIECFIAEQNMVGMALGLSLRGKIPFVSSFAAFLTRAYDQIRMSQYSEANIKYVGSHAGISIGPDGASQMGLEDISFFRTLLGGVVLYPGDAVSCERLVEEAIKYEGIVYLRITRSDTPVIYDSQDRFVIGGSKVVQQSEKDQVTVIAAGITLHETLAAYRELSKEKINIRVIDGYSIKPLDNQVIIKAAKETKAIITVEDHFAEGGLGEAVKSVLYDSAVSHQKKQSICPFYSLAVRKIPRSGSTEELLNYEEISSCAIIKKVKEIINQ